MSKKLGEILVEAGRITEPELHKALTAQLVFGGHIGTSLLELGYLDEETLGRTLASIFKAGYADVDRLERISYTVVRCLPVRLIEKHKVVPLHLEGRALDLAMIDPKNLAAIDEIAFVTGYRIVPWVAPEVRILQAMEKHYSIPRSQRFVSLAEDLERLRAGRQQDDRPGGTGAGELPLEDAAARAGAPPAVLKAAVSAPAGAAPPRTDPVVDHWEKYGYGRSWQDVADLLEGGGAREGSAPAGRGSKEEEDTRPHSPMGPAAVAGPEPPRRHDLSLMEASRDFAVASSVDDVVFTTLSYASTRIRRAIFFVVRGDRVIGWSGTGDGVGIEAVEALSFPAGAGGSILSLVGAGRPCYVGPPPTGGQGASLYEALRVPPPRRILVTPISIGGRIAAYLYGDGGDDPLMVVDVPSLLALCARAGLALQILLLRNKILAE